MFFCDRYISLVALTTFGFHVVLAHRQTYWASSPFHTPLDEADTSRVSFHEASAKGKNPIKRIAIIGAGAGGSSAAYFLNEYAKKNPDGPQLEIEVFEKSNRIGGRVYPRFFGQEHEKYEMGANAFIADNYNIMNASRDFQIEKETNELGDSTLGLYDGNEFVALNDNSWSNQAAFYYRYSWGSFRANRFANSVKAQFLKLYDESLPPYRTVEEMLKRVDLLKYLFQTSRDVLVNEWSAGPVYTDELFQAISRNIYASNSSLHSLAGAIALIAGIYPLDSSDLLAQGSYTTVGGNDQFFQKYLEHSGATVHFNSPVTKIKRMPGDSDDLVWNRYSLEAGGEKVSGTFDAVVLATPFHQSDIKVLNLDLDLEEVPYRTVYVAVIEDALVSPGFFHADTIPDVIFGFNSSESFTVIGHSPKTRRANIEAVEPISMDWLAKLFNATLHPDQVTFQTWKAYPKMIVKESDAEEIFPPINLGPSFYYVNSVEPAISCMEVEIMSGRNIARLVLDDLKA